MLSYIMPVKRKGTKRKPKQKQARRRQRGRGRVSDFIDAHPYLSAAGGILGSAALAGLGGAAYGYYGASNLQYPKGPQQTLSPIDYNFNEFVPIVQPGKSPYNYRSVGMVMPEYNDFGHADWYESF